MPVRNALLALAALALALPSGAPAGAEEGAGVGTRVAGTVYAFTQALPTDPAPRRPAEEVAGKCTYFGHTLPSGLWQFEFAGEAVAYSSSTRQPELTTVRCWMVTVETREESDVAAVACPGAACAASGVAGPWTPQSVKVCVQVEATFGPVDPVERSTRRSCSTEPL